jgi:23S rRNA (uridine2552-2'-O)-methyltransferase
VARSLRTARGRTVSQQRWLTRQINDPYVAEAKRAGLRSRAAFKLIQLDDRFHLLRPGLAVADLGAAPGGWTQIALRRGASPVVALDLLEIEPIPGAITLRGDFSDPAMPDTLRQALGRQADLVLSDMAPNTTGQPSIDHLRILALADAAYEFARSILAPGGAFVAKVLQGGAERDLLTALKRDFASVRHAKPAASRKESRELYVVAQGFRGVGQEQV